MPRFKNDQNIRFTKALFYETTLADKSTVVYTLKDEDHEGYPSMRRLYIETADPSEYEFAKKYLDGWDHWELLLECSWFKPYIEKWRRELSVKIKGKALANIVQIANGTGKEKFSANKYLLEWLREPAGKNKVGRPTKEAIRQEAHQQLREAQQTAMDYDRIFSKELN